MGMTYILAAIEKEKYDKDQDFDDTEGWTEIIEFDREDWLPGFISDCHVKLEQENMKSGVFTSNCKFSLFSKEVFEYAIKILNQLDEDVNRVLDDDHYDMDFRRKLAKGLVTTVYGMREYHYRYPKKYFPADDYRIINWTEDAWKMYSEKTGSCEIRDGLEKAFPYLNENWTIQIKAV